MLSKKEILQEGLIKRFPYSLRLRLLESPRLITQAKCINIHIPKTGGTTITQALQKHFGELGQKKYYRTQIDKHAKAMEVKELVGDRVWEDFFTFAFVRNPYDLMVSSYHWWVQKTENQKILYRGFNQLDVENVKGMSSFSDFISSKYGKLINEYQGECFDWISDENENVIVDFIGKTETIDEDWAKICKKLDIPHTSLPHRNKTNRNDYREYYDSNSRKIVESRFLRTIEKFKYEF